MPLKPINTDERIKETEKKLEELEKMEKALEYHLKNLSSYYCAVRFKIDIPFKSPLIYSDDSIEYSLPAPTSSYKPLYALRKSIKKTGQLLKDNIDETKEERKNLERYKKRKIWENEITEYTGEDLKNMFKYLPFEGVEKMYHYMILTDDYIKWANKRYGRWIKI